MFLDEFMALNQEQEDESDPSDDEWSRGTYSDASWSPSPPLKTLPTSHHPALKRKASTSLDEQKEPRRGTRRSKAAPLIPPKVVSTMLKLPEDTPATREAVFSLKTVIKWTPKQSNAY